MDDYPLTLTSIVERAERFHADREIVSRRPSGAITRTTFGACARRARRLAGALSATRRRRGRSGCDAAVEPERTPRAVLRGARHGRRHSHPEPTPVPRELAFIVDDAQDKVIVVDESLLEVFETFRAASDFTHVIVVTHSGEAARRDARLRIARR